MTAHTKTEQFTGRLTGRVSGKGRKAPALASLAVTDEVVDRLSREAGLRFEAQRDRPRHHLSPGLLDPVDPRGRAGLLEWCMIMAGLTATPTRRRSAAEPAPY